MPSVATIVGGTALPVSAGNPNSRIEDVVIDGLLAYLAHWIKWSLDAKLANLRGPDIITIDDACPAANRFALDPRAWWPHPLIATGKPGLWLWQRSSKRQPYSTVYAFRERTLSLLYAFPETLIPRGAPPREGLLNAVDASIFRACERGAHPTFAYGGKPAGTCFVHTVAPPGNFRWQYTEALIGFEAVGPTTGSGSGAGFAGAPEMGYEQYGFATLRGAIVTQEKILNDTLEDPADVNTGLTIGIGVNGQGDMNNPLFYVDRALPGPDGSEDGDAEV